MLVKIQRKDKEAGDRRNAAWHTKNRKMPEQGINSPPPPLPRRRNGEDAGSATQWRADALDFVASFLRLVRVLSSFL